jgi:hypothetical protein
MQQTNHTLIVVEEYRVVRREEKSVHKNKRKYNEGKLRDLELHRSIHESRNFYKELNEISKYLRPRDKVMKL